MIGREIQGDYYRTDFDPVYSDEVVVEVENLSTVRGLSGFSMQLHKGEILGIGGLSHCGMHELGRAMFGLETTLTGKVKHVPSGAAIVSPRTAMRHGLGLRAQGP